MKKKSILFSLNDWFQMFKFSKEKTEEIDPNQIQTRLSLSTAVIHFTRTAEFLILPEKPSAKPLLQLLKSFCEMTVRSSLTCNMKSLFCSKNPFFQLWESSLHRLAVSVRASPHSSYYSFSDSPWRFSSSNINSMENYWFLMTRCGMKWQPCKEAM